MTSRIIFSAVAVAALSLLAACGGGDPADDNVADEAQSTSLSDTGGIGGSGVTTQALHGVGAAGGATAAPQVGGIGGSGIAAPQVGGIGGSGIESTGAATAH